MLDPRSLEERRDEILALCRAKLAPRGLLYLSYNTNPGWLARGLVRDIMCGVSGEGKPLRQRAGEAVATFTEAIRTDVALTNVPDWTILGRSVPRPNARALVTVAASDAAAASRGSSNQPHRGP
mgnify:CR=1 FL=1